MSKKNSSVNLKKCFEGIERFSNIYQDFKRKLARFKTNSFLVAISGGPDSLALAALIKNYSYPFIGQVNDLILDGNTLWIGSVNGLIKFKWKRDL